MEFRFERFGNVASYFVVEDGTLELGREWATENRTTWSLKTKHRRWDIEDETSFPDETFEIGHWSQDTQDGTQKTGHMGHKSQFNAMYFSASSMIIQRSSL